MMVSQAVTLIEALDISLQQALRFPDGVTPPVALLWTDPEAQWKPLIEALRQIRPYLYALGDFDPDTKTGPVIWIKTVIDRTLPESSPPLGVVPIIYLPGLSRQELRAADDCEPHIQPLVELQYRGAMWHQRNGRDWTIDAFLVSEDGLNLTMSRDGRTREAMCRALPLLAREPLAGLRGRHLEAADFDQLAVADPVRDLLEWLSDEPSFQEASDANRWKSFREICARKFSFDPERDGIPAAADALLSGDARWDEVWRRFAEAPTLYPGITSTLESARPRDLFADTDMSRQPLHNRQKEDEARAALEAVLSLPHALACAQIVALDADHRARRQWVWAQLGSSPIAVALEPLGRLAGAAALSLGGSSVNAMAAEYISGGWKADRAAIDALAIAKPGSDSQLIEKIVRALYEPWLDRSARRFQELLSEESMPGKLTAAVDAQPDVCILFADGLRFDVGVILRERLESTGLKVSSSYRIAPIPTVTATAKPVASPAHHLCAGKGSADDFSPALKASGQIVNASRLREAMGSLDVAVLAADENEMPSGARGGWTEAGQLDALGHSLGAQLARQIDADVDSITDRINDLLKGGWKAVRVVTDHGWLLLPGGLPKVTMSPHLVATKWSRCAAVKGAAAPDVPTYPWHWDPVLRIATPPGIASFIAATEYSHGGISPQENIIPELYVERGVEATVVDIVEISWRGMRCKVNIKSNVPELQVDLRTNWRQSNSSIALSAKELSVDGDVNLAVADDRYEGTAAFIVVVNSDGHIFGFQPTVVGEM
jgi:hypothetical protein